MVITVSQYPVVRSADKLYPADKIGAFLILIVLFVQPGPVPFSLCYFSSFHLYQERERAERVVVHTMACELVH